MTCERTITVARFEIQDASAWKSELVTHFLRDGNGFRIQHVENSGGQAVAAIFGQPACASKNVFDPFGWHGNGELVDQPAALGSGTVMAELREGTAGVVGSVLGIWDSGE